jgi:MSHA biogenesis protein MshO
MRAASARERGFTLIELVITIAVAAVVVSMMSMFIVGPVRAYDAQSRRVQLVDAADGALRLMARDLRAALPNSVRVATASGRVAVEMLATVDAARYRDGALGDPAQDLDFTQADGAFGTATPFTRLTLPFDSTGYYLAIYNVGVPGASAWELANVITPPGTRIQISAGTSAGNNLVTLSPAMKFAWGSPAKRVYLVSGPVTWLCDPASGTLVRYSGYAIQATQPTTAAALAAAGATASTATGDLGACSASYDPGTPQRAGLVTLSLALARAGESVQLLHQVHLTNVP